MTVANILGEAEILANRHWLIRTAALPSKLAGGRVAADPRYLDVWVPPGLRKSLPVETERRAFAYVFEGPGSFRSASDPFGVLSEKEIDGSAALIRERTGNRSLVLFDSGDEVTVRASEEGIRFLLVSGATASGAHRPVWTDRDEHAGRAAAGRSRASRWNLHQKRLIVTAMLQLHRTGVLPCAGGPKKSRNRCGRESILFVALSPMGC